MCGIAGLINNSNIDGANVVNSMLSSIEHRGRDSTDVRVIDQNIVLGHTRLSILDTSSGGNQPYVYKSLNLSFNGEIYNFIELRKKLEFEGVTFTSGSDTEVLIKLLYYKGISALDMVQGMYAFALYDQKEKKLYLARDFFGEKPLYYVVLDNGTIIFASEIKSIFVSGLIKKKWNTDKVHQFLSLLYTHGEDTFYESVKSCLPNSLITINVEKPCKLKYSRVKQTLSSSERRFNWKELLIESVSRQLRADVPYGLWLSGGIDSSIIAGIASKELNIKLQTFTFGFSDSKFLDEKNQASHVSKIFNHENIVLNLDTRFSKDDLDSLIKHMDNPVANASILLYDRLSLESRKHIKVALTGVGGDELFSGYNRYRALSVHKLLLMMEKMKLKPTVSNISKLFSNSRMNKLGNVNRALQKMLKSYDADMGKYYNNLIDYSEGFFISDSFNKVNSYRDAMMLDQQTYLYGDLLYLGDLYSMKNNLETRAPFLNSSLVFKLEGFPSLGSPGKKKLLNNYLNKLSNGSYRTISKRGFSMPIEPFFHSFGYKNTKRLMHESNLEELVSNSYIELVLDGFFERQEDRSNQLLSLYILAEKRKYENI